MYKSILFFVISISLYYVLVCETKLHQDAKLNIIELTTKYDYPLETHKVITEDGYILTLHRIQHRINKTINGTSIKTPILLMHGFLSSSIDWLNVGPQRALGFILADAGYDVWLGNQRGNRWSKKHVSLNAVNNNQEFFNFSFHEIGMYDIPAKINFILNKTSQSKLIYIGHSHGTTDFFVMVSERPEYNNKIKLMVALAPVVYMSRIKCPIFRFLARNLNLFNKFVDTLKIYEVLPYSDRMRDILLVLCNDESIFQNICIKVFFLFMGFDWEQLDRTFFTTIMSNFPAGSSIKQMKHSFQEINSGKFQHYDYGSRENLLIYGQKNPPNYTISNIKCPVSIFYTENDWLTSPLDVERFAKELVNLTSLKKVPFSNFNHVDFLWGTDVVELLYRDVINNIAQFT